MGRENTCYVIFYVGASRIAYSVHTLLKWLLHSFFSFDLFTFFPLWRDARTIHIYVNLLDLIKDEKKDENCCIISHQNALEVNSCRILLWHTTNKLQLISFHSILVQSAKKRAPFFIASWESRSPCMLINELHSIKRPQANEKMHEKCVIKFNNCLRA